MKPKAKILVSTFLVVLFSYNYLATRINDSSKKYKLYATSINTSKSVTRAKGVSKYGGDIIVSTKQVEKTSRLEEDSSFGKEGDYVFQGSYNVIYENKSENKKNIQQLNNLRIIQRTNHQIKLQKLEISGFDLFVFTPQYSGSNDVSAYFWAITKTGKAFQFKFEYNKAAGDSNTNVLNSDIPIIAQTKKENKPQKCGGKLVIKTVMNVGGTDLKIFKVTFKPELKNRVMRFVKKAQ